MVFVPFVPGGNFCQTLGQASIKVGKKMVTLKMRKGNCFFKLQFKYILLFRNKDKLKLSLKS